MEIATSYNDLMGMLYRLSEPIFYPKSISKSEVRYVCSKQFYINIHKLYTPSTSDVLSFNGRSIPVNEPNAKLTRDINEILKRSQVLYKSHQFSHFVETHQQLAGFIIKMFMQYSVNDLITVAAYVRDRINAELFFYSLATVLIHKEDVNLEDLPTCAQVFPHKFMSKEAIWDARQAATLLPDNVSDRPIIEISFNSSASNSNKDHALAYFREDLGFNLHHYHWHLIYPFSADNDAMVAKDRRGELFYYMHHQVISRYNVERLSNKLDLVKPFNNLSEEVEEAYFPMLTTLNSSKQWASRPRQLKLQDIRRPERVVSIQKMEQWHVRLQEAIAKKMVVLTDGNTMSINNERGIDILGNIVEASSLSVNRNFYGSLHNEGHIAFGFIHDPDNKYNQEPGVMYDSPTAVRDPVFYRWHAFLDELFMEHKNLLPPYNPDTDLDFKGVNITSLSVHSYDENQEFREANKLRTFMTKSDFNVERGLDYSASGSMLVKVTHLNHENFEYRIHLENHSLQPITATVRIFMAPINDDKNVPLDFDVQRRMMIEMDRFVAILRVGQNLIKRQSYESSLIVSLKQLFPDSSNTTIDTSFTGFNYCQCGWPENLLVPKGTETGFPMMLFAMITDYALDKTETGNDASACKNGLILCGLKNKKYPDRRPMGYPFDRKANNVQNIKEFLTNNMAVTPIKIFFQKSDSDNLIADGDEGFSAKQIWN